MASKKSRFRWDGKICNPAQVGGIEISELNDGAGKGVRIAWVNTGSGLRYKVVLDRAADIADAFFNEHSLAWLSHGGVVAPRPDANQGIEWLYTFAGGLLVTCGLTHVGPPETENGQQRGLHDRISNIPVSVESIVQPDPTSGKLDMSITTLAKQSYVFGPILELKRTISSRIGEATIRVRDVVTNRSSNSTAHMILYHCNFGWPLVDEGADIIWKGKCKSRGLDMDNAIFNSKHNYRKCQKPLESHIKGAEACGFIDIKADNKGVCTAGIANRKLGLAVVIKYPKKQMPAFANWQHWGAGDYVVGLEPATNPPIGQIAARKQKKLIYLRPGKSRTYELEFTVLTDKDKISKFIKTAG